MRIDRRELLRQFGTAAASVFLPGVVEPVPAPADSSDVIARLDRNENAYGPSENAKEAFRQALSGRTAILTEKSKSFARQSPLRTVSRRRTSRSAVVRQNYCAWQPRLASYPDKTS